METRPEDRQDEAATKLHPYLYAAMVGLALWLLFSIWSLARTAYTDYLFVVVSGLVFFAVLVPAALWWTRRRHRARGSQGRQSFGSWMSREFDMWREGHRASMRRSKCCCRSLPSPSA
jgi:hypothetical protein